MRKTILFSAFILFCFTALSQDFSNKGKDFWVGYGNHVRMFNAGTAETMQIYITSDVSTVGNVSIASVGFSQNFTVTANQITVINIPRTAALLDEGVYNHGIHITADKPVVAYGFIYVSSISGATVFLPTNTLGKEYYSLNYTQSSNEPNSYSYFFVVAVEPGVTSVQITPSQTTKGGWPANVMQTVNLNQGQIYQVLSATDLTGSIVKSVASGNASCKKIAVFCGSGKINITPTGGNNSADNLYQQMYPYSTWGKRFVLVPGENRPNANVSLNTNYFRVFRPDATTNVYRDGVLIPPASFINNYFQFSSNVPSLIVADKPILAAQYFTTQGTSGNLSPHDPEMIYLNPLEQTLTDVTLNSMQPASNTNINQHFINVVLRNAGTGVSSFRIDGAVPSAAAIPLPQDNNYAYMRINYNGSSTTQQLLAGAHHLTCDSGFNAIAYGFGTTESYGYSAGANLTDLSQRLELSTQYGIEFNPTVCINTDFKFKVYFPDSTTATPPVAIRFDSLDWTLTDPSLISPNNFPIRVINPVIDSTNIRSGRQVNWYSLPGLYRFLNPGVDTLLITAYKSTSEGCGTVQEYRFPIEIYGPPTASFTVTPPGCYFEPAQFTETTVQTPKPTYKWYWDFGDGNFDYTKNPTHVYAAPGNYTARFAAITTAGCLSDTVSLFPVTIPDLPKAVVSHNTDTVCINTGTPNPIVFTGNDGKAPYEFTYTINGIPQAPVTSNNAGIYQLSVPVTVAGQFIYKLTNVRNAGSTLCTTVINNQEDTVTVLPNSNITLTSASGTPNQTVCINTPIINITYAVGGSGNGGTVTGLPAGVTGTYAGGTITISGTPTVSGVFNYTTSTLGPCANITSSGTLTVTADATLALTSAAGTDNQTLCINNLVTPITYSVGGSGTGGTVTGLPAGVTGVFAGGVITISGAPAVSGIFNYTVATTGPCVKPSATGTITVTADATLSLTSAAGTDNQTVCINNVLTNITYAVGGTGTGGSVTGLPAGVTGTFAGGIITITGTPAISGTFIYTVTTTGPCVKPTASGTITVTADATLTLTSAPVTVNQSLCFNTALVNITYAVGGTGTGAVVTGLPPGITGVYAGGVVTISGTATVSGTFNYTVTTTGPCVKPTATGSITIWALPTVDFLTSAPLCETRDIAFTDNSNPQVGSLAGWSWNFGDPGSGLFNTTTLANPVHNFSSAGNYVITLNVTTSNGCSNAVPFTRTITINDRPKAGFIVPEVCINDIAAVFIDTSKIANGTLSPAGYTWNYGDPASGINNTSTGMNGSHLYSLVGPYNVTHVVTSTLGCKDTVMNTIFINGANPVADFSVSNAATLCSNDSVAITNLSTISQGSITKVEIYWDWVGAPATVFTDDFPAPNKVYRHKYPTFQTPLTQPYTIRFLAYSGTLCVNAKNTDIIVNAAPKVQFNNIPDVCYDAAPFLITQGSEIGGVPGTFAYSGPGIVNPNGLFNPLVAGIGTHTIKYTFTSSAAGCVDTAFKTIKVLDTASSKFSFLSPTCVGNSTTFKEESTAPAGVTLSNTTWDFGDGSPLENHAPGTTFTHTYAAWGNYNVTMYNTSAYGCKSKPVTQTVYVSPVPNPAFAFGQTSVCIPNADVSFINNSTIADGTQNAFIYAWDFGDPASGALNTSVSKTPAPHHYTGTGPYTVTLTVTSGTGCINQTSRPVNFIHPQPKTVFDFSKPSVCIGDNVVMTDVTDGLDGTITQWFWKFSDGGSAATKQVTYVFGTPSNYNVSLYTVNSHGCNSDTVTKQFTVYAYPTVDAGPDRVVLEGGSLTIEPIVTGNGLQYLWTPATYLNDVRIKSPTAANVLDDITYTLTVTGEGGCTALPDKMFVKVLKMPKVPNTFTPNGDGINETWKIEYLDTYPGCKVQVFTRTGQLVFESKGYKVPWDGRYNGKPLPFDTYYYIIEPGNGRKPVTGYVTILK
ncbi:MAG: PKD domain-containing protein [Ferruginibacter sp.]